MSRRLADISMQLPDMTYDASSFDIPTFPDDDSGASFSFQLPTAGEDSTNDLLRTTADDFADLMASPPPVVPPTLAVAGFKKSLLPTTRANANPLGAVTTRKTLHNVVGGEENVGLGPLAPSKEKEPEVRRRDHPFVSLPRLDLAQARSASPPAPPASNSTAPTAKVRVFSRLWRVGIDVLHSFV